MKHVTVFCGSSAGTDPVYGSAAFRLGSTLAKKGIGVVYGGARVGLMGAVADGALSAGGEVRGVLPRFLQNKEIGHAGLTELLLVDTMHERKMKMHALSDGLIALPGGYGTMEEFFEMLTWGQLGLHQKPAGLLNIRGFYDPLLAQVQTMVDQGFLKTALKDMILVSEEVDTLLEMMSSYEPVAVSKWITESKV